MDPVWFYLLTLLIPVAALSGWLAARRNSKRLNKHRSISPEYFQGLNYMLNEQADKAIEVFVKMVEVDSETIETHLALGNLFRRRGEVDRAIRIHQNLIARPTLSNQQRALALLELAMDYMRSGLLDRAEALFKELLETDSYTHQALQGLLDIYQQEQDWDKAIIIARRLESATDHSSKTMIAQFYCEQAQDYSKTGNTKEVNEMIKRALNMDPACVRASLMEAEIAQRDGKLKHAIKAYKRVEKQAPEYITEIIFPLYLCYKQQQKLPEFKNYLQNTLEQYGGIAVLLLLTQLYEELEGEDVAIKFISNELKKQPTVQGVDKLIHYTLNKADSEIRDDLETIKELTNRLLMDKPSYKCVSCGFDVKTLHWHCPGCKGWASVKPVQAH